MTEIESNQWTPCPLGELDRLEARLRLTRFWQTTGTAAALVVAAITVALAGWVVAAAVWPESRSAAPDCSAPAPVECHE